MRKFYCLIFLLILCSCEKDSVETDFKDEIKGNKSINKVESTTKAFNPYYKATLQITTGNPIKLMGPIGLDLTLEMNSSFQGDPNDFQFLNYQIVGENQQFDDDNWDIYLSCMSKETSCLRYAKQPGKWKIRAVVYYNNAAYGQQTVYSNVEELEIIFPHIDDILADGGIQSSMSSAWNQTKASASSSGRNEKGFYIYVNTQNGNSDYEIGSIINGPTVGCDTNATITPGSAVDEVYNPKFEDGGVFAVAFYHCHTTLDYCPGTTCDYGDDYSERSPTGPSGADDAFATNNHIPVIVRDYSANRITSCTDVDAPSQNYFTGPSRRIYF